MSSSPDKPNISYSVRVKASIEDVFTLLVDKLRAVRCRLPRVIIYCRRCEESVADPENKAGGFTTTVRKS